MVSLTFAHMKGREGDFALPARQSMSNAIRPPVRDNREYEVSPILE
jgi:hypothetical protein